MVLHFGIDCWRNILPHCVMKPRRFLAHRNVKTVDKSNVASNLWTVLGGPHLAPAHAMGMFWLVNTVIWRVILCSDWSTYLWPVRNSSNLPPGNTAWSPGPRPRSANMVNTTVSVMSLWECSDRLILSLLLCIAVFWLVNICMWRVILCSDWLTHLYWCCGPRLRSPNNRSSTQLGSRPIYNKIYHLLNRILVYECSKRNYFWRC